MGRREIWSDLEIQKIASEYVCVIEETFFLHPPDWLTDPPNPASTGLFKKYVKNSPEGLFPNPTSTYQGLYCLLPDGNFLSGNFGRQDQTLARKTLINGLAQWKNSGTGKGRAVPTNRLAIFGGEELREGGLKLEVVYRDLPRGDIRRPGNAQFQNPYNLGWFDLKPNEAKQIATGSRQESQISDEIFNNLARTRLKDAVRGQMRDWKKNEVASGGLTTRMVSQKGNLETYELGGEALMQSGDLSFAPKFFGSATYDRKKEQFTSFQLLASGQRSGKGPANGRETDLGPAPMAIALTMYQP